MVQLGKFDTTCNFDRICTPFSLPSTGIHIPICSNQQDTDCYRQVLKLLQLDQHRHCKKACHVKEFILDSKTEHGHKIPDSPNKFALDLSFNSPSSTKNLRSDQPFKTMSTEYSTLSEMTLLGNVGGHLGMFVGFSFITCSEWFLEAMCRFLANKNEAPKRN